LTKSYQDFIEELKLLLEKELGQNLDSPRPAQTIEIYVGNYQEGNFFNILNTLGEKYRRFRYKRKPDYSQLRDFIDKYKDKNKNFIDSITYNRAWLGLPIIARYRSLNGKGATINVFEEKNGKSEARLASPVIFRVFKESSDRYGVLFIVLKRKAFIGKGKRFFSWKLTSPFEEENQRRVLAKPHKARQVKPVVMDISFDELIKELFKKLNVSQVPTLTFPREAKDATQ
jgi:hypothetical protein